MAKQTKSFFDLTPAQKKVETARFEEFDYTDSRPLSAKGKLLWQRAQRAGAKTRATIAIDAALLQRATELAKKRGLTRSQVVEQGLRKLLAG
jgi:hypothetical protein